MKKVVLIGLIGVLCIMLLLIIACVRPILPGTYVEIVYPAPGAVVPTEFSVLAVAGDVRSPPDVLKVTLGGREGYFEMESPGK